ncbi:hypothetical protein LIER_27798 [Lithospermum erythrorhizon]|uniref:Uncharacterized protein n=1 Tax=Lithospermum erythrorhizon TaxID=34254 RepID=A0AAV3RFD1_LITER
MFEGFKLNLKSGVSGGIEKIGKNVCTMITNFALFNDESARDITKFRDIVDLGLMFDILEEEIKLVHEADVNGSVIGFERVILY